MGCTQEHTSYISELSRLLVVKELILELVEGRSSEGPLSILGSLKELTSA
jgi:hypothetical protein